MGLTTQDASDTRSFLGFSDQFNDLDTRLQSQIEELQAAADDDPTVLRVQAILTDVRALDANLTNAALNNLIASKVKTIELRGPEQLQALRVQGRMLCQRLGQVFYTPPRDDYFGEGDGSMGGMVALG